MKNSKENKNESQENIEDLLKKFQKLESELIETLQVSSSDCFDEKLQPSVLKKNIKSYIKKVNKAKNLFDEYELVAQKIEKLSNLKKSPMESLESVIDLRKTETSGSLDSEQSNNAATKSKSKTKSKYKDELLVGANGKVVSVKKKASENESKEY